jgi:hypothetical protein
MVVDVTIAVVAESTKVRLGALLFLNGHRYNFYLIVCKADLNLEFSWHNEFIGVD